MRRSCMPIALALALTVVGCSASMAESGRVAGDSTGSSAARERPSERGMARAIDRVLPEARRCLRAGDPTVMIAGEFDGAAGTFRVTRIVASTGSTVAPAVETCVRAVAERAHVRAFRVSQVAYAFTLQGASSSDSASASAWTSSSGSSGTRTSATASNAGAGVNGGATQANASSSGSGAVPAGRPSPASLVRAAGDTYQRCYEQALERDHRVEGSVTVRMVLDREGQISRLACEVETDHPDPTLMQLVSRCVEAHVRTIQFGPQYDPGHEVVVPLAFNPGGVRR